VNLITVRVRIIVSSADSKTQLIYFTTNTSVGIKTKIINVSTKSSVVIKTRIISVAIKTIFKRKISNAL